MNWHPDPQLLAAYAAGRTDQVLAASIESHAMACESCRGGLAPSVDPRRLDAIWAEVIDGVDAPRVGLTERLLMRLGLRSDTARLLTATPSLRAAWLAAVALVLIFASLAAHADGRHLIVFLTLAPLAPVAGVALAFGRTGDPTYEIGVAAPYPAGRLLMIRAAAVLATTVGVAALASLLLPRAVGFTAAWLLPALALTGLTLAVSERIEPAVAAGAIAAGWVAVVIATRVEFGDLSLFGRDGQVACLALAVASIAELWRTRNRFNLMRRAV